MTGRRSLRWKGYRIEHKLAIYSGRDCIGHIHIDGEDFIAFGADGQRLGRFADQASAAFAIGAAAHEAADAING